MTIPWLMNCPHSSDSWCLPCVREMGEELSALKAARAEVVAPIPIREISIPASQVLREPCKGCGKCPLDFIS